ncbi:hypothetical protein [Elizabethkingia anophelis]|uniref:hypothetical protein n=1 Tax=Elizabethkingia anophelis TaxID=1117645 RepID=UPI00301B9001
MKQLNTKIETFLIQKTELDCGNLPQNYPTVDKFEEFQIGYKIHGWTKENLTGTNEEDFKESWYVLCSNYCDDPFFVDFQEEEKEFPVYFAFHGAGGWTPIKIAENIQDFSKHLIKIKEIENEKEKVISYLSKNFDIKNEFWNEVYREFMEDEVEKSNKNQDWEDWILGKLIITNIGVNKLKIVNLLKEEFKLTPQEALSLSKQTEIEFKKGYLKHLQFEIKKLNELGATTDFRPNEK